MMTIFRQALGWLVSHPRLIAYAVAALAVWSLAARCHAPPVVTPDDGPWRHTADSLRTAHSADSAAMARQVALLKVQADSFNSAARYQSGQAARLRRWSDSVVAAERVRIAYTLDTGENSTQSRDTATVPRIAWDSLSAAMDTLTAAFGTLTHAYRGAVETASAAYTGWMTAEGRLSLERSQWEDERNAWRATVKKLRPCRLCIEVGPGVAAVLSQGRVAYGPGVAAVVKFKF